MLSVLISHILNYTSEKCLSLSRRIYAEWWSFKILKL